MAVIAKPKPIEVQANEFIEGNNPAEKPKKKSKSKSRPIIVRGIDEELLELLDNEAAENRVSRAAMVRILLVRFLKPSQN